MSEQTEYYKDLRQISRIERAERRARAVELLEDAGIKFSCHGVAGAHIIARVRGTIIDIFPGPDWWSIRGEKKRWRGIDAFIERAKGSRR